MEAPPREHFRRQDPPPDVGAEVDPLDRRGSGEGDSVDGADGRPDEEIGDDAPLGERTQHAHLDSPPVAASSEDEGGVDPPARPGEAGHARRPRGAGAGGTGVGRDDAPVGACVDTEHRHGEPTSRYGLTAMTTRPDVLPARISSASEGTSSSVASTVI